MVTSDCRPCSHTTAILCCSGCGTVQKLVDTAWHRAVHDIYASYEPYYQAGGAEQKVFDADGGSSVRSIRFLHHVIEKTSAADKGSLLDVGCGNGCLLTSMQQLRPNWRLSGFEPVENQEFAAKIRSEIGRFYSDTLDSVTDRFDLVTLVHVLEHVNDPVAFLKRLANLLDQHGKIAIEVPDYAYNPFDLIIFDHCVHFDAQTLAMAAGSAGLSGSVDSGVIPKETTAVLYPGKKLPFSGRVDPDAILEKVRNAGCILAHFLKIASNAAADGICGVFGTAVAGTWMASALGQRITFFVDEDTDRAGRMYLGRPVYTPENVPEGAVVVIPLASSVAVQVQARMESLYPKQKWLFEPPLKA